MLAEILACVTIFLALAKMQPAALVRLASSIH
jgi:hypothetical protein